MSKSNRSLSVLVGMMLLPLPWHTAAAAEPTLKESFQWIKADLGREGPAEVLASLDRQPAMFDSFLTGIETADTDWLDIATRLRVQADGSDALSIDMAVARALPKHPRRVLALVNHGFELERICTSPFIEPEAGVAERYASSALAALATINDPSLKPTAAECAKHVQLPAS